MIEHQKSHRSMHRVKMKFPLSFTGRGSTETTFRTTGLILIVASLVGFLFPATAANAADCDGVQRIDDKWSSIKLPEWQTFWSDKPAAPVEAFRYSSVDTWEVDPDDPSRLFATDGLVLAQSLDGGCSWKDVFTVDQLVDVNLTGDWISPNETHRPQIQAIVIPGSKLAPKRLYVIVSDWAVNLTSSVGDTLYVSNDDGATFTRADNGLPPLYNLGADGMGRARGLQISESDPSVMYALTLDGVANIGLAFVGVRQVGDRKLYRSTDAGASWNEIQVIPFHIYKLKIDPLDPNQIWLGNPYSNDDPLYYSSDGGASLTPIVLPEQTAFGTYDFGIFRRRAADPPTLMVQNTFHKSLFSPDGGYTWKDTYPGGDDGSWYVEDFAVPRLIKSAFVLEFVNGRIFRFDLRARNWVEIPLPFPAVGGPNNNSPTVSRLSVVRTGSLNFFGRKLYFQHSAGDGRYIYHYSDR